MSQAAGNDTDTKFEYRPDGDSGGAEEEFIGIVIENEEAKTNNCCAGCTFASISQCSRAWMGKDNLQSAQREKESDRNSNPLFELNVPEDPCRESSECPVGKDAHCREEIGDFAVNAGVTCSLGPAP